MNKWEKVFIFHFTQIDVLFIFPMRRSQQSSLFPNVNKQKFPVKILRMKLIIGIMSLILFLPSRGTCRNYMCPTDRH